MNVRVLLALVVGCGFAAGPALADIESGPKAGDKAAELKVFAATGDKEGKEVNYAEERKEKPTVYLFVSSDQFTRPMARMMKKLDEELAKIDDKAAAVAVWIGDKPDNDKDRLPKVQQSVQFTATTLNVFTGDKAMGPKDWGINPDAHLTVVVVHKGKVVKSFAFQSVNETDMPPIRDELKKAVGK
jgi:hypothetical protein